MKKKMWSLLSVLTALLINVVFVGQAEAAWVAVVPIEVNEAKVERATDFNSYYWDIMIERFPYPDYEILEDEKVLAVIPEKGLASLDKTTLVNIAGKTDAEIVVAMRLDEIEEEPVPSFNEPKLDCVMMGEFASYNRLTGKYYRNKLYYKDKIEEVLVLKNDWQQQVFASELKRYINRTLEDKKSKK